MGSAYVCAAPARRAAVAAARGDDGEPRVNGIDHLEVSPEHRTLRVRFVHPLPGENSGVPAAPALSTANVVVEGGVRVRDPAVVSVTSAGRELTVEVAAVGDRSPYQLRLTAGPGRSEPPPGFDVPLSTVRFTFAADCPSDFDCRVEEVCTTEPLVPPPAIDYLARDYASLRRLMLDRLAVVSPQWRERNPADAGVAVVELLAYVGDQLSYAQDAASTEAYLGTARRRSSVRRHARLLDYRLDEGANARTWMVVQAGVASDGAVLPGPDPDTGRGGTAFLTGTSVAQGVIRDDALARALAQDPVVFEALHGIVLRKAFDEIELHTWGEDECCLPVGSTRATLRNGGGGLAPLAPGALLLFEEVRGPVTGEPGDADPTHRHVVRLTEVHFTEDPLFPEVGDATRRQRIAEVAWATEDALPFAVCADHVAGGQPVTVVRGNVVLADHGVTRTELLAGGARPELSRPVTRQQRTTDAAGRPVPFDPTAAAGPALVPADPLPALPAIRLHRPGGEAGDRLVEVWLPKLDLLASGRFSREFVCETEEDGRTRLRFGDGSAGAVPVASLAATYRTGGGTGGNIGPGALVNVAAPAGAPELPPDLKVTNPLPGVGGRDPEPVEQARLLAPQAFRRQERAVTEADYAEVAQRHPDVARAIATRRWTGSWHTMFLTVDRRGGAPVDAAFEARLRRFLERFRLMGHDLEIDGPRFVPLDVELTVCVAPGYLRSTVLRTLIDRFGILFHPDALTFAQPVYLSSLVAAAMAVPGVTWVDVDDTPPKTHRFQRYGRPAAGELAAGRIELGRLEIARLDNDPDAPENGRLVFHMEGGL